MKPNYTSSKGTALQTDTCIRYFKTNSNQSNIVNYL